jgi:hypothetical protein
MSLAVLVSRGARFVYLERILPAWGFAFCPDSRFDRYSRSRVGCGARQPDERPQAVRKHAGRFDCRLPCRTWSRCASRKLRHRVLSATRVGHINNKPIQLGLVQRSCLEWLPEGTIELHFGNVATTNSPLAAARIPCSTYSHEPRRRRVPCSKALISRNRPMNL